MKNIFSKIKTLFSKKKPPTISSTDRGNPEVNLRSDAGHNVSTHYINYEILRRLQYEDDDEFKDAVIKTIGQMQVDDFDRTVHLSNRDQMQYENYSGEGGSFSGGGASGSWDSDSNTSSDSSSRDD